MTEVIGAVFARGGSVGVPDKNLRVLGGKPLVARAVEAALACAGIDRVILSTDSPEIAEAGRVAGAEVPWLRPAHLATATSPEWHSWQHLLGWLEHEEGVRPDRMLVVPCTAPLRATEDLERCLAVAAEPGVDVALCVATAYRNPWFNMVTVDDEGNAALVLEPPERIYNRQAAPVVYDVTTVAFVARSAFVLSANSLYDGVVRAVVVPVERSLDIDTEHDLALAELMLASRSAPDR